MTDRPYGDDVGDEDEVATGDLFDAMFEVETSGEALPLDLGDEAPEPVVVDDADFAVGPQMGEDLPPEFLPPDDELPSPLDDPLDDLDPFTPGNQASYPPEPPVPVAGDAPALSEDPTDDLDPFTPGNQAGYPPEDALPGWPVPSAAGEVDPSEAPTDDLDPFAPAAAPEPEAAAEDLPIELDANDPGYSADDLAEEFPPGDSLPTADWLLGGSLPAQESEGEAGIPAGYEYLFQDSSDEDAEPGDSAVPTPAGDWPGDDLAAEAGAFPADFDLPDWAGPSDDTVTSTTEYADLAEEVARSAGMVAEPSAVAANMPGLDTGLVGLEDVVGDAPAPTAQPTSQPDLALRVLTGLGLLAVFAVSLLWQNVLAAVATVVFVAAAGELYAVLRANGYRPVAAVGLPGTLGAIVGTWVWGLGAVPVALLLTLVALALQMAMVGPPRATAAHGTDVRQGPLQDAALTMLGAVWIGGLGAFAFPIITATDYRWLIVAVVVIVVGLDVGQYFVGRRMGKRPLAPVVSPKKTVEGLIGGAVFALAVAVVLWAVSPLPLTPLVVLAAAAVVLGPLGDLSVSVVKRILGVKDMGTILPGHGGILDRIDALLFVLPAAWLVFEAAGLLT